jgi:hypothetical protein
MYILDYGVAFALVQALGCVNERADDLFKISMTLWERRVSSACLRMRCNAPLVLQSAAAGLWRLVLISLLKGVHRCRLWSAVDHRSSSESSAQGKRDEAYGPPLLHRLFSQEV